MSKHSIFKRAQMAGAMMWGSAWDAANPSPNRGNVSGGMPQDFKHEYSSWTRQELTAQMRSLAKNNGLIREYINTMALYSTPVSPQSLVDDHAWRKEAEQIYADRRRVGDSTGRFSGAQIQSLSSKAVDRDGEIFILKVIDRAVGLPRLQMIESHRVGAFDKDDTIDGIKVNRAGAPTHIRVRLDDDQSKLISMSHVLHIYDPESPSALRHAPTLAHAINHQIDADEILALEKMAVKTNADIARIVRLGGDDVDDDELAEMLGGTQAAEAERSDPMAMQKVLGGKSWIAKAGEDVQTYESNRPNPTFTGFLTSLDRNSALGGLPYEFFVNPSSLNAGAIRLIVARVQRIAKKRAQLLLDQFLRPDWFFVIGEAINSGDLKPVKNWHRIDGGFPAQVTVDAGRNDASIRENLIMGVTSPSAAFAEAGLSFSDAMEQKAQDLKELKAIAEHNGLEPEELFSFAQKGAAIATVTPPSAKPAK